jgi:hypothetical protein
MKLLNESYGYRRDLCDQPDEWFSFAFVRNPFDLVWDAFVQKVKPDNPCVNERMCQAQTEIRQFHGLKPTESITFRHFVVFIGAQKPRDMDYYWVPASWRCRVSGPYHFPYSFMGRVEKDHMEHIVTRILEGVGMPHAAGAFRSSDLRIDLDALNHSTHDKALQARALRRNRYRCDECSNPLELRNIVSKVYHNDIAKFYFTNF